MAGLSDLRISGLIAEFCTLDRLCSEDSGIIYFNADSGFINIEELQCDSEHAVDKDYKILNEKYFFSFEIGFKQCCFHSK